MANSLTAKINQRIEKLLRYPGCGEIELSSRKAMWSSTIYGFIHVFILTFSFLFFVPELTILIQYGFACLVLLILALIITPFITRFFKHYFTIHLLLLMMVTFYTIIQLGGIVTSVGLIVACFSFVLLAIPLQSLAITISLFIVYSIFVVIAGIAGPYLTVPEQITPIRNSIIWMINTLSMSALSLLFVVDFITRQHKFEELEANKQKELNEAKTKLFTNITHEFRTPLTIIQGMADLIYKKPDQWLSDGTQKIKNNSGILLRLVNQMLDISKIEAGSMPLHLIQGNLVTFIGYVTGLFRSVAHEKNIKLIYLPEQKQVMMDFDPDKIVHIVSNLLANALKYTPENGSIEVKTGLNENEQIFKIQVIDNGTGIEPHHLPYIFDRFYQVGNNSGSAGGTGLGLALAKEFTEMLNGKITVQSMPGSGTTFTVQLPVTRKAIPDEQIIPENLSNKITELQHLKRTKPLDGQISLSGNSLPALLIVEDSADVSQYLAAILQQEYHIELAENGKTGLEKALNLIPDIVLTDVMMPEMDGIEMLEKIKNDFRTSHIPVVMLTAKADIDSRLTGLARGADAYLSKPFNENELHIQLRSLIEMRKKLHERYASLSQLPESKDVAIKTEDEFILKVRQILENNLANEDYNINDLCRELAVSHAQLYRKFKSISNQTIADYFKLLRLHKAKELLAKPELNITQIAFTAGFKNLSHFSREFTQQFGKSPKEMRKQK
ncbi:MAG TPA: ATP-binding protein [Draconibacterium sp.]|nr:ATP-binding protein [Draconibacterium sp.]